MKSEVSRLKSEQGLQDARDLVGVPDRFAYSMTKGPGREEDMRFATTCRRGARPQRRRRFHDTMAKAIA